MSKARLVSVGVLVLLLLCISGAVAASINQSSITWQVLSAGGAPAASTSGHFSMNGSLGQTAIGPSSSDQATLWAGFWHSLKEALINAFIPIVVR